MLHMGRGTGVVGTCYVMLHIVEGEGLCTCRCGGRGGNMVFSLCEGEGWRGQGGCEGWRWRFTVHFFPHLGNSSTLHYTCMKMC